ncbi:MAG: PilZ domain-containing protein [Nitrospira sp.]|nr:PilZ domain-containing protein [Nitrospira sp.]
MPATRFVIRAYHRVPLCCGLYYMGEEFLGKGTVMDLSPQGLRIRGDCRVVPGTQLVARLFLPEGGGWVDIPRIVVCWAQGPWFGAKWLQLSAEAEKRINKWLASQRELLYLPRRQQEGKEIA